MNKSTLPGSTRSKRSRKASNRVVSGSDGFHKRDFRNKENNDVLVSAVISTYLLTHLHHVLQRAEYGAMQEGRLSQATNFAQLRKVLCMDARSMEDASAIGCREGDLGKKKETNISSKSA